MLDDMKIKILGIVGTPIKKGNCQYLLEQALEAAAGHDEVMVIGGAQLYRQTLERAERMYLTLVKTELDGDTLFPQIEMRHWRELERESHRADEKNEYDYDFVTLERVLV
jgi:dihydrofolate reductase